MSFFIIGVCERMSRSMLLVRLSICSVLASSRRTLLGSVLFSKSVTLEDQNTPGEMSVWKLFLQHLIYSTFIPVCRLHVLLLRVWEERLKKKRTNAVTTKNISCGLCRCWAQSPLYQDLSQSAPVPQRVWPGPAQCPGSENRTSPSSHPEQTQQLAPPPPGEPEWSWGPHPGRPGSPGIFWPRSLLSPRTFSTSAISMNLFTSLPDHRCYYNIINLCCRRRRIIYVIMMFSLTVICDCRAASFFSLYFTASLCFFRHSWCCSNVSCAKGCTNVNGKLKQRMCFHLAVFYIFGCVYTVYATVSCGTTVNYSIPVWRYAELWSQRQVSVFCVYCACCILILMMHKWEVWLYLHTLCDFCDAKLITEDCCVDTTSPHIKTIWI